MLLQKEKESCVCSSLWTCAPGNTVRRLLFEISSVKASNLRSRIQMICTVLIRGKINLGNIVQHRNLQDSDHIDYVKRLLRSLGRSAIFRFVSSSFFVSSCFEDKEWMTWKRKVDDDIVIDLRHILSILILSLPRNLLVDDGSRDASAKKRDEDEFFPKLDDDDDLELKLEIRAIRVQIDALRRRAAVCNHHDDFTTASSSVSVVVGGGGDDGMNKIKGGCCGGSTTSTTTTKH